MTILKHALLATLRIVFLGSLKAALFVYVLFLPDTAFADTAPEGNGYLGNNSFYAAPKGNNGAGYGRVEPGASRRAH